MIRLENWGQNRPRESETIVTREKALGCGLILGPGLVKEVQTHPTRRGVCKRWVPCYYTNPQRRMGRMHGLPEMHPP